MRKKRQLMKTKKQLLDDATARIWDEFRKEDIRSTLDYLWEVIIAIGYDRAVEDFRSGRIAINKEKFHRTLRCK